MLQLVERMVEAARTVLHAQGDERVLEMLGVRGDFTLGGAAVFFGGQHVASLTTLTDNQGRWKVWVSPHGEEGQKVLEAFDAGCVGSGLLRKK